MELTLNEKALILENRVKDLKSLITKVHYIDGTQAQTRIAAIREAVDDIEKRLSQLIRREKWEPIKKV